VRVHFQSNTDLWATPQELFDRLNDKYGFTTDVCALPDNAKCPHFYTPEDDGLVQKWEGVCWMNPPYGRVIGHWMKKAYDSSLSGVVVVCLVPARTDTAWWHNYAMRGEIEFLRGRLKFGNAENSAPFPSAIVVFGGKLVPTKVKRVWSEVEEMNAHPCPFRAPAPSAVILQTDNCRVLWDGYPVSPGHALIVPKEHIPDWFAASPEMQNELSSLIAVTKAEIEKQHQPDGYNVGFNAGAAAGQTISHLHIHVIPRYVGDLEDPRGGVRRVIPDKAMYWEGQ